MNFKLWFVFLLAASLLVSVSEAGKDRRKKQKTKERLEDDDDNEQVTDGKSIDESGKGKGEKERTSVLEKQTEKNSKEESSSSEEEKDDEKPDNSTIIIRRKRGAAVNFETNNAKLSSEKRAYSPKHFFVDPENTEHGRLIVRRDKYGDNEGRFQPQFGSIRAKRALRDEGRILPTDGVFQTQRSRELNDGVQLSLSHKPAATASTN